MLLHMSPQCKTTASASRLGFTPMCRIDILARQPIDSVVFRRTSYASKRFSLIEVMREVAKGNQRYYSRLKMRGGGGGGGRGGDQKLVRGSDCLTLPQAMPSPVIVDSAKVQTFPVRRGRPVVGHDDHSWRA